MPDSWSGCDGLVGFLLSFRSLETWKSRDCLFSHRSFELFPSELFIFFGSFSCCFVYTLQHSAPSIGHIVIITVSQSEGHTCGSVVSVATHSQAPGWTTSPLKVDSSHLLWTLLTDPRLTRWTRSARTQNTHQAMVFVRSRVFSVITTDRGVGNGLQCGCSLYISSYGVDFDMSWHVCRVTGLFTKRLWLASGFMCLHGPICC